MKPHLFFQEKAQGKIPLRGTKPKEVHTLRIISFHYFVQINALRGKEQVYGREINFTKLIVRYLSLIMVELSFLKMKKMDFLRCPREVHFKTFRKVELNDSLLLINGGRVVWIETGRLAFILVFDFNWFNDYMFTFSKS